MKLFLLILIFLFSINSEAKDFLKEPVTWKPVLLELKITEDLTIYAHYLKEGTPSPISGLLLNKDDFDTISTKIIVSYKDLDSCVNDQRKICDTLIQKCNEQSYILNEDLIKDKKLLKEKLILKDEEYKKLKFNTKVILITSGTFITLLTASLVYASL